MCYSCWQEMNKPHVITPEIVRAASLCDQLYDMDCVGGNLHIVTDDWNLEDEHVQSCADTVARLEAGVPKEHDSTDPAQIAVERQLLDLFKPMTENERGSALALHSNWIDASGVETVGT